MEPQLLKRMQVLPNSKVNYPKPTVLAEPEFEKVVNPQMSPNDNIVTNTHDDQPVNEAHGKKKYFHDNIDMVPLRNTYDVLQNDIYELNDGIVSAVSGGSKVSIDSDSEVNEAIEMKDESGIFKDDINNNKEASTSSTTVSHV